MSVIQRNKVTNFRLAKQSRELNLFVRIHVHQLKHETVFPFQVSSIRCICYSRKNIFPMYLYSVSPLCILPCVHSVSYALLYNYLDNILLFLWVYQAVTREGKNVHNGKYVLVKNWLGDYGTSTNPETAFNFINYFFFFFCWLCRLCMHV